MHSPFTALCLLLSATLADDLFAHEAPPALPEAVQEIYPAVYKNKIWVAGGISSTLPAEQGNMTDKVHFWSTEEKQWQQAPSLPEGRHHTYLQAAAGKLFAFGGFINSEQGQWLNTADVLLLDETKNAWRKVAELPIPLSETVGAVINGKIHLAGGRSPQSKQNGQWQHSTDTAAHFVFDPLNYTFSQAKPLPSPRNSAATVVTDNGWVVIGGRQIGGNNLTDVLIYDVDNNNWRSLPPLPEARAGHAAALKGDYIYIFGGEHHSGVYQNILKYHIKTSAWQSIKTWPEARHGLGSASLSDQIWLIGGALNAGLANTRDELINAETLLKK